jgi:hypothetical protein
VSKDQFQSLAGVVLPSRQIADPAARRQARHATFASTRWRRTAN